MLIEPSKTIDFDEQLPRTLVSASARVCTPLYASYLVRDVGSANQAGNASHLRISMVRKEN